MTSDAVREFAQTQLFGRGCRQAIVAPRDEAFGIARMFELMDTAAEVETKVFRDATAARRWLGLTE